MMRITVLMLISLITPVAAGAAEGAAGAVRASTGLERSDQVLKHALQDILQHYYRVKVTVQYCASRFDDMQPDLSASHSRWVRRNAQIVTAARQAILELRFSADDRTLDRYLMSQIEPGLQAIQRNNSTEQKVHCFDTMVGIDEGAIDIANQLKDQYELLRSL